MRNGLGLLTILCLPLAVQAMTLDEYLAQVKQKHRLYQSFEISQQAAGDRYQQGDLALSPVLTLKGSYLDDKSLQQNVPTFVIFHQKIREYGLGLGKRFSTGTSAQVNVATTEVFFDALTPATISDQRAIGTMGFTVSQSLWKDGFGSSTRLRWQREESQKKLEIKSYDLQAKQVLIEAEAAFWDLVYLEDESKQRESSLERAKKIASWISGRVSNGIGERPDLLNAQGLVATRELQLLTTRDELAAAHKKIVDTLEASGSTQIIKLEAPLGVQRPLLSMVENYQSNGRVIRLDTYLAALEARTKHVGAQEVEDSLRPDLVVEAGYRTNTYQTDAASARNHLSDSDKPTAGISVKLTLLLDGTSKEATRRAAGADALSARLKRDQKIFEGESSWEEIQRRHAELSKKIEAAEKLSRVQNEKAKAERDRLMRGRTVTSQVVSAEQDAAEADLLVTKMKAEQRKLETQARLFMKIETLPE